LQPSPSLRSIAVHEIPEASYDTSLLRPSASSVSSVSSVDRLSTIPASPSPQTSLVAGSPLASITPVPTLPPTDSSLPDVSTPSSLSFSTGIVSVQGLPVEQPAAVPVAPRTPSTASSSFITELTDLESSLLDQSLAGTAEEEGLEADVGREIDVPPVPREDEEEELSSISTEPSLLSMPAPSEHAPLRSVSFSVVIFL
jgi:hypothetical protein